MLVLRIEIWQVGAEYRRTLSGQLCVSRRCDHKEMEYYKAGGSEKHLRDITGILKISGESVDRGYITDWARRLELAEIWDAIQERLSHRA